MKALRPFNPIKLIQLLALSGLLAVQPSFAQEVPPNDQPPGGIPGEPPPEDGAGPMNQDHGNAGGPPGKPPGGGQRAATKISGSYTVNGTIEASTNQTYAATASDVSAVLVQNGGRLQLNQPTITKHGHSSNEENSSFHGQNAGVLATRGSQLYLIGGSIKAIGLGANGAFATGTDALVSLTDTTISADGDAAHGIMVSGGGQMTLTNVTIVTYRSRSGAVATDRGGGRVFVSGGSYTTHGTTSPGIYSTGNIEAQQAAFIATSSEGAVIEGKNSIVLNHCSLSGAEKCGVMIYQSFSGDAEGQLGAFTMNGGSLSAAKGPLFFVSNTHAAIQLSGAELKAASGQLVNAAASRWGRSGANGGQAFLTANAQALTGDISADKISSASLTLQNHSTLTGAIHNGSLSLDGTSQWMVTADSNLTTLTCAGQVAGLSAIQSGGHTIRYASKSAANQWLEGKTYPLPGGGNLQPQ